MHPALLIDEIVTEILRNLSPTRLTPSQGHSPSRLPSWYWKPRRQTFAPSPVVDVPEPDDEILASIHTLHSLSVSCRSLSERALDELWASPQGGLYSIFSLFSSFTVKKGIVYKHDEWDIVEEPQLDLYVSFIFNGGYRQGTKD